MGRIKVAELPLLSSQTAIPMLGLQHLTPADQQRVAKASVQRVLIFKKVKGQKTVRIVQLIPSLEYARNNNFDISKNTAQKLQPGFAGYVVVAEWQGKVLSVFKISKGGKVKKIKTGRTIAAMRTGSVPNQANDGGSGCGQVWVSKWEPVLCVHELQNNPEEPINDCNEWVYEDNGDWEDVPCEDEDDDLYQGCMTLGGTSEECACQVYSICDDGGDGGGDPEPDPCAEAQNAATNTTTISQSTGFLNAKSTIQAANNSIEHTITLGRDANNNITTSSMTSGGTSSSGVNTSWPGAFGDLHNHPNDLPPSPGDMYNLIGINTGNSSYNTRMVITPDGSVFALVVLDLTAANTFKNNYPPVNIGFGPDFPSEIYVKFDEVKDQFMLQGLSSIIAEERAMAYVLDKFNTGVALLKQDSNGNFKRLKTDESTSNGNTTYTANNCQ